MRKVLELMEIRQPADKDCIKCARLHHPMRLSIAVSDTGIDAVWHRYDQITGYGIIKDSFIASVSTC